MAKVVWFEIYVDDIDRAQKFYETVLDTQMKDMQDPTGSDDQSMRMKAFPGDMDNYGAGGALVKMEGGGQVTQSKMAIGDHGFVSLCTDTEGNMFGLHSME